MRMLKQYQTSFDTLTRRMMDMPDAFSRERMLLGEAAVQRLQNSHVIVFGLGGVGSFAVEALARAGVGELTLVDDDVISLTNLNRQLYACTPHWQEESGSCLRAGAGHQPGLQGAYDSGILLA